MSKVASINPYSNCVSRKREEQPEPKYHCASCSKCTNSICSTFNRHVKPNYNRCFNHSNYNPIKAIFKAKSNLDNVIQLEKLLNESNT